MLFNFYSTKPAKLLVKLQSSRKLSAQSTKMMQNQICCFVIWSMTKSHISQ